MVVRIT